MVAVQRVRPEAHVVEAAEVRGVLEVLHAADSSEWRACFSVSVVWGAASMPTTPPFSAHAFSTWSGFMRFVFQRARAPTWVMKIGFSLTSIVSRDVWSPECEMSMAIPSWFIRRTA